MLGSGSIIMLHELKAKGKSSRAIVKGIGLSRNIVRKYLRADGIPQRKPHPTIQGYYSTDDKFRNIQLRGHL